MSLSSNVQNLAIRVATEVKALRILINGNSADLAALTTTDKTSLVGALNWLHSELQSVAGSASGINDTATATTTTWSSQRIASEVSSAISALVDNAPTALDTLAELAAALQEADSDVSAILSSLDNRVRVDAPQAFDVTQQAQARANIGAGTSNLVLGTTADTAKPGNYTPPAASISASGIVELATTAETTTGTDTSRAVTPAGLKAVADTKVSLTALGDPETNFVATFEAGLA